MSIYPGVYTNLNSYKARMAQKQTSDDDVIKAFIRAASEVIDHAIDYDFVPFYQARVFDYPFESRSRRVLSLDYPLLTIESVADASGTLSSDSYIVKPYNTFPKWSIVTKNSYPLWQYNDEYLEAITVTGYWGHNRNPNVMWQSVGTLANGITSGDTALALSAANVVSDFDYLQIDSEIMLVTDTNGASITVERGLRGTTAEAHDSGDTVAKYRINADVQKACEDLAIYFYQNKDKVGIDNVQIVDVGVLISQESPRTIINTLLGRYQYTGGANV